ncbi:MAG: hypothetical protein KF726_19005 [Anaerolineae bacterium]|nr:hypothetical protein [Anaerolineae bacterium]
MTVDTITYLKLLPLLRLRRHQLNKLYGRQEALLEAQVVSILKTLKPPENWRSRITEAMGELPGDQKLDERLKEVIARTNFR